MRTAGLWLGGLVLSAVLHGAAAGLYLATRELEERPAQQTAESQFQLDTVTAPTQSAEAQEAESESVAEATPDSAAVGAGAVAQSRASALDVPASQTTSVQPSGASVEPIADAGESVVAEAMPDTKAQALSAASEAAVAAVTPETKVQSSDAPSPTVAAAVVPNSVVASSNEVTGQSISAVQQDASLPLQDISPVSATSSAILPETATSAPVQIAAAIAQVQVPTAPISDTLIPATQSVQTTQPNTDRAPAAIAQTDKPLEQPLPATTATAALAWQFGDRLVTDPKALATIQAFMAPGSLANSAANAGDVKDGLTDLLTSVDCARMSATFLPESGTLEMRGHIPDPSLRGPLLDALRARVGDGIPVTANLLHLPAPQCGALTGIANVGLPQSTDQFTNERLVGVSAHAREYTYAEGQRLQFDLTAPDYDAFVYVDYFSADGNVIHLVPNETIALKKSAAEALFGVGQDRGTQPSLRITIGPPFGQEIAVAFAASEPLYDGLRPISEPAEPYLDWLQARVAEARERNPDFKGEWVYFFITTQPNTQ